MTSSKKSPKKKFFKYSLIILIMIFIIIQFIPVKRINPPITKEPAWDSQETRSLAVKACFDCHSNETKWPAYAYTAPVSWWIIADVNEGRKQLNMSDWRPGEGNEAAKEVREGEMPKWQYTLLHSEAKLTNVEKNKLISGLIATFGEKKIGNRKNHSQSSIRDKSIRFSDEGEN